MCIDEETVFVEPLVTNFEILEEIHLKPTESVLILGDGKMGQLGAQVLTLSGSEVLMVGKHEEKLALAEKRGVRAYVLHDAQRFALENGRWVDMVTFSVGFLAHTPEARTYARISHRYGSRISLSCNTKMACHMRRFSMRALVFQNNALRFEKRNPEPSPKEGEGPILHGGIRSIDV